MAKSKTQEMSELMYAWQQENNTDVINYKEASRWATENKLFQAEPISPQKQCENEMRNAIKRATWVNPQGRRVRIYGVPRLKVEGEQLTLFPVDMRITNPAMAKAVFDSNFDGIGNDVKRHSIEKQSFDDNNKFGATLPTYNYDFNHFAEDARLNGEYDDSYDEDDFNEIDES